MGGFKDCIIIVMASSAPDCLRGAAGASSGEEVRHRRVRRHRSRRSVLVKSGRWAGRWKNLPRPLVRATSGCRGDTHEVAGVLSEEVVLQRGLQGLPGTGWYVPEGSGAGPWEDRSASYTGSTWTVSSELGERVEAWLEQAAEAGAMEEVEGWRAAAQVAALEQQMEELQGQVAGLEGEQARVE